MPSATCAHAHAPSAVCWPLLQLRPACALRPCMHARGGHLGGGTCMTACVWVTQMHAPRMDAWPPAASRTPLHDTACSSMLAGTHLCRVARACAHLAARDAEEHRPTPAVACAAEVVQRQRRLHHVLHARTHARPSPKALYPRRHVKRQAACVAGPLTHIVVCPSSAAPSPPYLYPCTRGQCAAPTCVSMKTSLCCISSCSTPMSCHWLMIWSM